MGINGLLPALKPIAKQVHISKYRGQKAAVDGYSWLHKGAYCCAKELCERQWTDKFVIYFMSRIKLLRSNGIDPVVVFDGGRLPIKGQEEQSRHRARQEARDKAAAHLAAGNVAAAVECYQRCVDITPRMAKQVIEELKAHDIAYIVAPYEADAQMAYLIKQDHVQLVITEDSDLLAYACSRVLYKLDRNGSGEEVSMSDLPHCSSLPLSSFTSDQFLQLCVMAGCDFLSQLPGIGLKKAHGLLRKYQSFTKVLKILRFNGTKVPAEYEVQFQMALWAFRHCRVYCPTAKVLVHLAPLPAGGLGAADVDVPAAFQQLEKEQQQQRLDFLGPDLPQELAQGIAEGRLDPSSHKPFDLAAIFAGCKNPPQHILAQLQTAPGAVPHLLAFNQSQHGVLSGLAAASGGSRSGAAAAASGGGRSGSGRVGLSKKHAAQGQKKLSWQTVAALPGSKGSRGATGSASNAKKKATLGIAKFFSAPRAAAKDTEEVLVGQAAAEETTAAATAVAGMPATVEPSAPSTTSMQHSINQALQALKQQQQQRQQLQQNDKQRLLMEIKAHEQQGVAMQDSAVGNIVKPAYAEGPAEQAAKRWCFEADGTRQERHMALQLAGDALSAAAADGSCASGLISSSHGVQDQLHHIGDLHGGHVATQHKEDSLVSRDAVAAAACVGRCTATNQVGDEALFCEVADGVGLALSSADVTSGSAALALGSVSERIGALAPDTSGLTDQPSQQVDGDPNLLAASEQIGGLHANSFTAVTSAAATTCSDGMLGSLGLENSGSMQLNPSLDSSTGVPAASGGRGAAVSALTALFRGPQQQPLKARAASELFPAANTYAVDDGDDDLLGDLPPQQGQQERNALFSSSCPSGGMLASEQRGSLPGFSDSDSMLGCAGLSRSQDLGRSGIHDGYLRTLQQQHVELQGDARGCLSSGAGNLFAVNDISSSFLSPDYVTQEQQQQQDEGEPEVVSPPRPHGLALGGSSNQQVWKRLQQTLRGGGNLKTGLKRSSEPIQLGDSLQRLRTELNLGTKRSRFSLQTDSSPDWGLSGDHDVGLGSGFSFSDAAVQDDLQPHKAAFAGAAAAVEDATLSSSRCGLGECAVLESLEPLEGYQQQQGRQQPRSPNGWCAVEQSTQQQQEQLEGEEYITIPDSDGEDDYGIDATAAAAAAVKAAAEEGHRQQPANQEVDDSGTDGSSLDNSNDENATPDIHSIAHMKKYAKLAARVVNKVQRQQEAKQRTQQQQTQQQTQKRTPLAAANTAAVLGNNFQQPSATQRPATKSSRQGFNRPGKGLKGSQQKGKVSRTKQRPARHKSLAAEVAGLKYDPCMFVPVQTSPDRSVPTISAEQQHDRSDQQYNADQTLTTGFAADRDNSGTTPLGVSCTLQAAVRDGSFKPQNRVQGMFAKALAVRDVGGADAAAAKPFRAPWLSQKREADSGPGQQTSGAFGAFGGFACGDLARAGSMN